MGDASGRQDKERIGGSASEKLAATHGGYGQAWDEEARVNDDRCEMRKQLCRWRVQVGRG